MTLANEDMAAFAQGLREIYESLSVSDSEELLLAIVSVPIATQITDELGIVREKINRFNSLYLKRNFLVNDIN
jgi:hypothetical protein